MRRPTLDLLAEDSAEGARSRAPALRTQLLMGLALILLVVATSTGFFAYWSARQQLAAGQLSRARALGHAVAGALAPAVMGSVGSEPGIRRLRRALAAMGAGPAWGQVEVYSPALELLGTAGAGLCPAAAAEPLLRRAVRMQRQLLRPLDEGGGLEVATPIYGPGTMRAVAAVRLCLPLAEQRARPLLSVWIVMAVDSFVLLLFVGVVVTRYVTRPLQRMRRAAAQVASGDLDVQLSEDGSAELGSLAASFNRMTLALRVQLNQLEQQQRSLVQSEKLASVGRLAAGIAHEVGNPLQSIIGFTDILLEQKIGPEEREDFLRRIQGESQRIHGILRELLDYSRPGEESAEAVELSLVVNDALSLVQHTSRFRAVEVEVQDLGDAPAVLAVPGRLVQVLVNLLLNAADAMEGAGRVQLRASADPDVVRLHLSNTGPPIPLADQDRIFDPFFTTKSPGEGTGLGLAVARSISESFGGQLALDREQRQTTFVVTLPRA